MSCTSGWRRRRISSRCTSRSATSWCSGTCRNRSAVATPERLGQFQLELRRRLIESGEFYIVSTRLDGVGALRVTVINPLTTGEHLDRLLEALREKGRELLAGMSHADETA